MVTEARSIVPGFVKIGIGSESGSDGIDGGIDVGETGVEGLQVGPTPSVLSDEHGLAGVVYYDRLERGAVEPSVSSQGKGISFLGERRVEDGETVGALGVNFELAVEGDFER